MLSAISDAIVAPLPSAGPSPLMVIGAGWLAVGAALLLAALLLLSRAVFAARRPHRTVAGRRLPGRGFPEVRSASPAPGRP